METKIISMTQPLIEGVSTPEELVVYTARVSNPENQLNMETADRLLNYLIKHKHWSPFEMVDITVEIKTSRAIAAQILRHRSFSFQEFSQRYSEVQDFELVELRRAGATNRQSSMEVFNPTIHNVSASKMVKNHIAEGQRLYDNLLANGVAKECARMVLPLTVGTTLYMKGSLRSWIHYFQIRCDEHTQLEHREIALNILELFRNEFPNVIKAISL
jgi:thymidylate synthase (FAD)